jgi:hypothetical protein
MFVTDFSFVGQTQIRSRFAVSPSAQTSRVLDQTHHLILPNAQQLYESLLHAPSELSVHDAFALMSWQTDVWQSKKGHRAMKNWWASAQQQPVLKWVMTVRVVYADSERWPGPRPVVFAMREACIRLIDQNLWTDGNAAILKMILQQDHQSFAKFAFDQQVLPISLVQQHFGFNVKLPVVQDAEREWLQLWLGANDRKKHDLIAPLKALLSNELSLERQIELTKMVLHAPQMPNTVEKLQAKILSSEYPLLSMWLSQCYKNHQFRNSFSAKEQEFLACWVGAGTYGQFEKLIGRIASHTIPTSIAEFASKRAIIENKYIVWLNYQYLLRQAWILIPQKDWNIYQEWESFANVKPMNNFDYPLIILHVGDYCFIQPIVDSGRYEIVATLQVSDVQNLINGKVVDYNSLRKIEPFLLHDLLFKWQTDFVYVLECSLGLHVQNRKRIKVASAMYTNLDKILEPEYIKERSKAVRGWLAQSKSRYSKKILEKYALTAIRYGLLTAHQQDIAGHDQQSKK